MGDKWTLLIVRDLASGPRRFVELQRVLPGISTEQLRSRLNRMVADGMLTRKRYREVPPRVDYELTERARELMPILGALARWGYEWAWSTPRSNELVDIGAIFRLAPGLLPPSSADGGTVRVTVEGGRPSTYLFTLSGSGVQVEERPASVADASVTAGLQAWIDALSPERERRGLTIDGDVGLAGRLLDALTGAGAARTPAPAQVAAA